MRPKDRIRSFDDVEKTLKICLSKPIKIRIPRKKKKKDKKFWDKVWKSTPRNKYEWQFKFTGEKIPDFFRDIRIMDHHKIEVHIIAGGKIYNGPNV